MKSDLHVPLGLLLGVLPGGHLERLPVAVVKGLELGSHVHEVVGGVLLGVVDESRIGGEVAPGEVIGAAGGVVDVGNPGGSDTFVPRSDFICSTCDAFV